MSAIGLRGTVRGCAAALTLTFLAACGPEGSNATDRARVDDMLANEILAYRPSGATVTLEPTGRVSESSNVQYASGGDNGAIVELEIVRADLDAVAVGYVNLLQLEGWSEIDVTCFDQSLRRRVLLSSTWVGYEMSARITLIDRGSSIDTSVILGAPFHDSKGTEPDPATPPILDCLDA